MNKIRYIFICLLSLILWAEYSLCSTRVEDALANEISRIIEGRLDKRLYLVFVTVKKQDVKKETQTKNLPLMPFGIDKEFIDSKINNSDKKDEIVIENLQFTISVVFDETIADPTIETLRKSIQKRFAIDEKNRKLEIEKSKMYSSSNNIKDNINESMNPNEGNERLNAEINKLENEKSKALIESERSRLELTRKEFEFQKNQAKLEEQIRKGSDKRDPLVVVKDFQNTIAAILIFLGVLIGLRLWGTALKSGMGLMADGIKMGAQGIGEALNSGKNEKNEEKTGETTLEKSQDSADKSENSDAGWTHGNSEFEAYIAHMQEKIEVLGRENNFAFVRQFTDMIEDDKMLPLAASLLVALPNEMARVIVQDVGSEHLRRIHRYLESPGGLASAKSLHKKALQEFYGRIAMDEFTNSPLMKIKNINWLTRMTSEQMADFVFRLPQKYRAAFIACLSPYRTKSMLQSAKRREVRESIVRAIAAIGEVSIEKLNDFLEYAKSSPEVMQRSAQKQGLVDDFNYLAAVVGEFEPEDEEILSNAIANNANLKAKVYQFYLPFKSITRVPREWISQIFESRQKNQIALILFDSDTKVREHIISCLSGIKAEAVKEELKGLEDDKVYSLKNKKQSRKLQKEISTYILGLINNGTIELTNDNPQSPFDKTSGAA
jgi:flagellar motor switch protein FliG